MLTITIDMESPEMVGKAVESLYFLGFQEVDTIICRDEERGEFLTLTARTDQWSLVDKDIKESIGFNVYEGVVRDDKN